MKLNGYIKIFLLCLLWVILASPISYSGQIFDPTGGHDNPTFTGTSLFPDGTAAAPSRTYTSDTDTGSYRIGTNNEGFSAGGSLVFDYNTSRVALANGVNFISAADIGGTQGSSSLILQSTNGIGTTDYIDFLVGNNGGTRAARILDNGTVTIGSTGALTGSKDIYAASLTTSSGTGVTVNNYGSLSRSVYKVTIDYTALNGTALTYDKTIATLPAKMKLVGIVADTTTKYIGNGVSAVTLIVGKSVGGNEYITSHDVFSAAITKGLADADLGTSINRANAVQGGDLPSWTSATAVSGRITAVGATTSSFTQGSTTYYLIGEQMP